MNTARSIPLCLSLILLAIPSSCGYHVGGKADTIPQNIQTIAVLPFTNLSSRYKLSDQMQQAISRELVARTRFHVSRDADTADAVLGGAINNVLTFPVVFDPATNKTTIVQISVYLQFYLKDRVSGKVLYSRPVFEVKSNYEVSLYTNQYFDESSLALGRVTTDLARTVVTGIVENF